MLIKSNARTPRLHHPRRRALPSFGGREGYLVDRHHRFQSTSINVLGFFILRFLLPPSYISSEPLWAVLLHAAVPCTNEPRSRPRSAEWRRQVCDRASREAPWRRGRGTSPRAPRRRRPPQTSPPAPGKGRRRPFCRRRPSRISSPSRAPAGRPPRRRRPPTPAAAVSHPEPTATKSLPYLSHPLSTPRRRDPHDDDDGLRRRRHASLRGPPRPPSPPPLHTTPRRLPVVPRRTPTHPTVVTAPPTPTPTAARAVRRPTPPSDAPQIFRAHEKRRRRRRGRGGAWEKRRGEGEGGKKRGRRRHPRRREPRASGRVT